MTLHTTKKEINKSGLPVYQIGYCAAQHLLTYQTRFAYSTGVYGWNCDYYEIDNVILSTGYRPHGKPVDYDTLKEYDTKAEKVVYSVNHYEDRKNIVNGYLHEYIKTLKGITK